MSERPHRRLIVWQKAMDLIERIYKLTERFPSEERFGLVTQMRRAAISVASNIAEGSARQTAKETLQALYIARGSISELDTQVDIACRLQFINHVEESSALSAIDEVGRLMNGLIASKRRS